jgi:hypothetical protein
MHDSGVSRRENAESRFENAAYPPAVVTHASG